jgi:hypothetical protein
MTALPDPAHVPADGNAMAARAGKARGPVRGDPGRAARLIAGAERAAQSVTDEDEKPLALVVVAGALAATDPGRAVRIVESITDQYNKVVDLTWLAGELAATDPGTAARLIADAVRIVESRIIESRDTVVFQVDDGTFAVVHLTWAPPPRAGSLALNAAPRRNRCSGGCKRRGGA